MKVEYVPISEAAKETVLLRNSLLDLGVIPSVQSAVNYIMTIAEQLPTRRNQEHTKRKDTLRVNIT